MTDKKDNPLAEAAKFTKRAIAAHKSSMADMDALLGHGRKLRKDLTEFMLQSEDEVVIAAVASTIGVHQSILNQIQQMRNVSQRIIDALEGNLETQSSNADSSS